MKPRENATNILSTTRATAKMHEFRVAPEDFIALPRDPAMLFDLAVGASSLVVRRDRLPAGTVEADRDVEVALVDVLLARPVPPPPLRRSARDRR